MKKAITLSAATLALLVAGASGASAVSAASAVSTKDSTGTIGFTANTSTPPDITNPEVQGVTGQEGGTPGELAIDYVSDLNFGQHQISSKKETYFAKNDTTAFKGKAVAAFVEMHDLRGLGSGGKNGTQLTVTQDKQFKNPSGAELKAATLSFSAGTAANAGGGNPQTSTNKFELTPGVAQTVMSTDGTVGQFLTSYGQATDYKGDTAGGPISLSVPSGSALAGTFTAKLVWNLAVAP